MTLAERKVMVVMLRHKGPSVVGSLGLFQLFADGFKLFVKEKIFHLVQISLFLF